MLPPTLKEQELIMTGIKKNYFYCNTFRMKTKNIHCEQNPCRRQLKKSGVVVKTGKKGGLFKINGLLFKQI